MKISTTSTVCAAAVLVSGVSGQRLLQGVPQAGLDVTAPVASVDSSQVADGAGVEEKLVQTLQADPQVTVVGAVDLGEVMCDSLGPAEDAAALSFVIHNETIVAERTSYTFTSGSIFEDGVDRHVWAGEITSPAQAENEASPRAVSMTWDDECNIGRFLLKVTKQNMDGTTSVVKSVPCGGVDAYVCLVEVLIEVDESDETIDSEAAIPKSNSTTSVSETGDSGEASAQSSSGRRLMESENIVIDVMILYSTGAMAILGNLEESQMQTFIVERLASTNQAFINSEVPITFNPVYIGLAPFEEIGIMRDVRLAFAQNEAVALLRDQFHADLAQMVGSFPDACGGSFLIADELSPFSVVKSTCLDDNQHTRFFGFSLGGDTLRTNSGSAYSQGLQSCSSPNPFRTLLTFQCPNSAPTINYFSNPDVTYLGTPTGTPTNDNARAIRDNMVDIANYRSPPPPPTVAPTPTPPPTMAPTPTPPPTTAPTPEVTPETYSPIGCYGDSSRHRVLSGVSVKGDPEMTTERCGGICEGSAYVGTEYSNECFCGPPSDDPTTLGESTCNHPCAGDLSQTCGGYNAISLYEYDTTVFSHREVGCFVDDKHDRVLSGISKKGDRTMTTDVCAAFCQEAEYYGTEYGEECFCSSERDSYSRLGRGICDFPCAGASSGSREVCGGRDAITVYRNDDPVVPPPPAYLGCWRDTRNDRIMQRAQSDAAMTNDLCEQICAGMPIYGTQFGVECWCGEKTTIFGAHGRSTACTMECPGDAEQICGGYDAMSVWER